MQSQVVPSVNISSFLISGFPKNTKEMDIKFAIFLTAFLIGSSKISAQMKCQTCMLTNGAYCVDETSYYFCLDNINPSNTTLFTCDIGQVCTDSVNICEPERSSSGAVVWPACSSSCGVCPDTSATNQRYTCVSKTQFGRCVRNAVTMTGQCKDGHVCSSELYAKTGDICAPECVTHFFGVSASCDSEEAITTTTTTAAPVNIENIKKQCTDALPNYPNERIFNIRNTNDNECKTYIFCEKFDNEVDGLLVKCAEGNWFDPSIAKCGNVQPLECSRTTS